MSELERIVRDAPEDGADSAARLTDDPWDVFLGDDDPSDPWPEPGDFWIESEG